jgi:hypothetical protein
MARVYATTLLLLAAASCSDDPSMHSNSDAENGGHCPGYTLKDLCRGACPADPDAAAERLCTGTQPGYVIYENDCGGRTVTDPDTNVFEQMLGAFYLAGTAYYFDADDKLVGGARWSDAIDPNCRTPPFYGEECRPTSNGELHRCED